ncbi:Signal transduction response regulator, receiver region domain protein, partial [Candidatus Magnetomorum sp. HK-1]
IQKLSNEDSLKNIRGAKILLAEDNDINQQVARDYLEQFDLNVTIVENGVEAIQAVLETYFDLVFMDIQMPEMDGYKATKILRENPRYKNLPIIAMTAHAMASERKKSLDAGMNDHITKPIDPNKLIQTLIKWISPGKKTFSPLTIKKKEKPSLQEEIIFPEKIPGIDINSCLKRVGNNKKLLLNMFLRFNMQYKDTDEIIKNKIKEKDLKEAQNLAHSLKGIAGTIGANDLSRSASHIENFFKQKDLDDADNMAVDEKIELNIMIEKFSIDLAQVVRSINSLGIGGRIPKK